MPSTIVKLSSSDARAWAQNQPVWLDAEGAVHRPVAREEQHAISRALERSRRINQSFRLDLPLLPVQTFQHGAGSHMTARRAPMKSLTERTGTARLPCAFEVGFVGQKRTVTVYNGDYRYATGREVLAARLLADHGECVLHGRNGKCIGVLRDPLIAEREPMMGKRVQWSRNPDDIAAAEANAELARNNQSVSPVKRPAQRARTNGNPALAPKSPKNCPNDCRGLRGGGEWTLAKGARPPTVDEHHPICQFAAAWAATLAPAQTSSVLYDLELGQVARAAMDDELAEADAAEQRTGIRQVTVGGRLYAVLPAKEAAQAAREARGEGAEGEEADSAPVIDGAEPVETEPKSLDLGDEENSGEPDEVEPLAASEFDASDRSTWPMFDEINPSHLPDRPRTAVTPRDYLARKRSSADVGPVESRPR